MTIEFRLLGAVTAEIDGRPVDLGTTRQRCTLAILLAEANKTVSADQLIDRLWPDRPPRQARASLQTYLSRLRRIFAATTVDIIRRADGYLAAVDEETIDLHRFRAQLHEARRSSDDRALRLIEQALALSENQPFADLALPWLTGVGNTLLAERLAAVLDRNDLKLRRGEHAELLPSLTTLAEARPLDERVAGQLMLALYRSGRQADALAGYQRIRTQLADELGVDPGVALREVQQQILTADDGSAAAPTRAARTAGEPSGAGAPVPRQLPATPRTFVGRIGELDALRSIADDAGAAATLAISSIGGIGGVGKTWLALYWAQRNLDRFPDGQLFVNLRGFDPAQAPMAPETAIVGFLGALGVPAASMPPNLDSKVGLYRSLLATRKMLIVLDNAADAEQVVPLLPGSTTCTVLITSRTRMTSLINSHGAHSLALDILPDAEARALLAGRIGPRRLEAEPEAVAELLACCAGLPLALSIVAGRAEEAPDFPLSALAAELHDVTTRLEVLDEDPAASVRAVLS